MNRSPKMNQSQRLYHVIRPKDTIFWLARMYDTTVEDIVASNPGINPHNLQVGSRIVIYPGGEGVPQPNQPMPNQPQPNQPQPNQPQPNQPQPNQPMPNQPQPNQPQPNQPMPNQPRPNQPQPNQPRPNQPMPNQPRPNQPQPNQPRPNQPMPNQPQPNQPQPNQPRPNQPRPNQPQPNQQWSNQPRSNQSWSNQPAPGQSMSSQINRMMADQTASGAMYNQTASDWMSTNPAYFGRSMSGYQYDSCGQAGSCGSQDSDYYVTYYEYPFIEYIPPEDDGYGPPMTNQLLDDMRRAWSDHVWWMRMLLISLTENLDDLSTVRARTMKNPQEIANIFLPYFSEESAKGIANLLTEHLQIGSNMIVALRDNKLDEARNLNTQWHENAAAMAEALSTMNPNYDRQELQNMLEQHLNTTAKEINARIADDYTADIAAFDLVRKGAEEMADYLANGIVQ